MSPLFGMTVLTKKSTASLCKLPAHTPASALCFPSPLVLSRLLLPPVRFYILSGEKHQTAAKSITQIQCSLSDMFTPLYMLQSVHISAITVGDASAACLAQGKP